MHGGGAYMATRVRGGLIGFTLVHGEPALARREVCGFQGGSYEWLVGPRELCSSSSIVREHSKFRLGP